MKCGQLNATPTRNSGRSYAVVVFKEVGQKQQMYTQKSRRKKCFTKFFANDQLDETFLYLYLLNPSTCFEHHSAHHRDIELY